MFLMVKRLLSRTDVVALPPEEVDVLINTDNIVLAYKYKHVNKAGDQVIDCFLKMMDFDVELILTDISFDKLIIALTKS